MEDSSKLDLDADSMGFTASFESLNTTDDSTDLSIKVEFEKKLEVSIGKVADVVHVKMYGDKLKDYLVGETDVVIEDIDIVIPLPTQGADKPILVT